MQVVKAGRRPEIGFTGEVFPLYKSMKQAMRQAEGFEGCLDNLSCYRAPSGATDGRPCRLGAIIGQGQYLKIHFEIQERPWKSSIHNPDQDPMLGCQPAETSDGEKLDSDDVDLLGEL